MFDCLKVLPSSEGNVWKYVFEMDKNAISESVLYRYESFEKRTVLCVSVQSGCPVGCTFCGTGENFIRNLTSDEIVEQVHHIFKDNDIDTEKIEKLQIMFMSMGEPFLAYHSVEGALKTLNQCYPNADLLISTIGPKSKYYNDFIELSKKIDKIGLQFSIHKSTDEERSKLIPFERKLTLREIRDYGESWHNATGRKVYLNYCVDENNSNVEDFLNIHDIFSPFVFNMTFSVICSADENMKDKAYRNISKIEKFKSKFDQFGYNTRVFDPAGQDDIGGGCGQLWFVQEFIKERKREGIL